MVAGEVEEFILLRDPSHYTENGRRHTGISTEKNKNGKK